MFYRAVQKKMLTGNKDPLLCRVGMLCRVLLLSFGLGVFKKFTQSFDNEICIEKKIKLWEKNPIKWFLKQNILRQQFGFWV